MTKEQTELLTSMLEGFVSDLQYEFDLDNEQQAVNLISKTIEGMKK